LNSLIALCVIKITMGDKASKVWAKRPNQQTSALCAISKLGGGDT
jgi:hypothetical protein